MRERENRGLHGREGPGFALSAAGRQRTVVVGASLLAILFLPFAGCDGADRSEAPTPSEVPLGAVAIVGATPITAASFQRWQPIVAAEQGVPPAEAKQETLAFLLEAQWVLQEAEADGLDREALEQLVARRIGAGSEQSHLGMRRADRAFQARVDIVAHALRRRHGRPEGRVGAKRIARHYRQHRSAFRTSALRESRMVVTHRRAAALEARSALAAGRPWEDVAERWSVDSSKAVGGIYRISGGVSPPALVRAAFGAPRGRLVGPLRAPPAAGPPRPTYYLFKVTGARHAEPQPLARVRGQIRRDLEEGRRDRALAAYARSFERRWRARTLCVPTNTAPQCRNHPRSSSAGNEL